MKLNGYDIPVLSTIPRQMIQNAMGCLLRADFDAANMWLLFLKLVSSNNLRKNGCDEAEAESRLGLVSLCEYLWTEKLDKQVPLKKAGLHGTCALHLAPGDKGALHDLSSFLPLASQFYSREFGHIRETVQLPALNDVPRTRATPALVLHHVVRYATEAARCNTQGTFDFSIKLLVQVMQVFQRLEPCFLKNGSTQEEVWLYRTIMYHIYISVFAFHDLMDSARHLQAEYAKKIKKWEGAPVLPSLIIGRSLQV